MLKSATKEENQKLDSNLENEIQSGYELSVPEKLSKRIPLYPYELMVHYRFESNKKILRNCQLVTFENRPNQIYLSLDQNATNPHDIYIKNQGDPVCIAALFELCHYYGIDPNKKGKGFRVANLEHHVEIYKDLQAHLIRAPVMPTLSEERERQKMKR